MSLLTHFPKGHGLDDAESFSDHLSLFWTSFPVDYFLKDWADHMYENRLMYSSLQASDPLFFAKVLIAIDDMTPYRSTGNHVPLL